jgi:hypothetical protein
MRKHQTIVSIHIHKADPTMVQHFCSCCYTHERTAQIRYIFCLYIYYIISQVIVNANVTKNIHKILKGRSQQPAFIFIH